MNLIETEAHLKLWGHRLYRSQYSAMGYSRQPLSRLLSNPGSDIPAALYDVDAAVSILANEEPFMHQVLIDRYGRGLSCTEIGELHPDPVTGKPRARNSISKYADTAVAYVAGRMARVLPDY